MNSSFCCDTFWNVNETWNVDVPDFSSCFQDTVFVFIPSIIFIFAGVLNFCLLSKNGSSNSLPWTPRIILRFILCFILFIISAAWCVLLIYKAVTDGDVPISALTASMSRSLVYVIVITLMFKNIYHGVTTSTVLSSFWICFAFTGIIMHRSIILKYNSKVSSFDLNFILSMIYYPLVYLQFILSFFVDIKSYDRLEVGSPFEEECLISSITYVWFNRIVYRGIKRLLTVKDFLPLAVKLKSSFTYQQFSKYWKFHLPEDDLKKQNLAWTLLKSFWPFFVIGFILQIVFNFGLLLLPIILDGILEFVTDDRYSWKAYFFGFAIFLISFIVKNLHNNFVMYFLSTSIQVKSCLISAVYRKNLMISSAARKNFTSGSISNLISVDVYRISQFALFATSLISAPLRIVLILALLWQYLGPSCLSAIAVIALLIPLSFYMTRISERFTERQMAIKDARLKCMNEILQGIKILKFYAWEVPFSLKVSKTRKEEIKAIQLSQLCYVVTSFVFGCAPILVSIASFTTFLLVDKKNVLDPTRAFVSLNLLDQLRFALFAIPDALSEMIQTITSIGRIKTFLTSEETESDVVTCNPGSGNAVSFTKATLSWSKVESVALESIDFEAPKGGFMAVIGPVGSGKSTLLSAILGDLHKSSGSVDVQGSLAYVPQEAWILNRSLKNNILLEKPMHQTLYKKVLQSCCLNPDLEMLPAGDETEIGEKGINLSGGQKQRISLARAVFQNKDIYIMDDPLSAVDAHVRKSLIQDVIGNQGLLRNKTRILVTHDISVLEHVDFIIRMEAGKIVESGSYMELMANSETFLKFIKTHANVAREDNAVKSDQTISNTSAEGNIQNTYKRTISEDLAAPSESKHNAASLIEDEKMEEGGVKRGIYLNYLKHIGWPVLTLGFLGYVAFTAFETAANIWVADWSSDAVHNGTQNEGLTVWRLSVYGGFGVAQALTLMFGIACLVYGSTKASELYHSEMLASILKSPLSFFDITPMGRIINRFSTDMDTMDIQIIYDIDAWLNCILYCITIFIIIGINTPIFLAYVIPLGILYYIFLKLHLNTSRQIQRLESTTRSPIYSHLLESIYGVNSIKSFEVEKEFIEKLEHDVDNHVACSLNTYACNRWLHFWLDLIASSIVLIATLLIIEDRQSLKASIVGLIITYALSVTDALVWIVRTNTELENQSVAIERIEEYCHLKPEAAWQKPDHDPAILWPESGEIVFDNYSTKYRENLDLVLKDINLNIHTNEKVGIVGRTGAGKSSVTLALFRIIEPAQGTILIDNVDVSKIGLHALRSKLTIIPQDPVLFTGSLRFNLDPNDEYKDEDVWKSLENAHLKDFVSTLSEGLQYSIEEGGGNLSAGQKQLLCLSRALLRKSKILVLDEATAAVDMDTDSLVQDTIKTAFANHTVITIAHRLNTVMDYDKIVVMNNGEIVEVGRPADLIQMQNSHFFSMARKAGLI